MLNIAGKLAGQIDTFSISVNVPHMNDVNRTNLKVVEWVGRVPQAARFGFHVGDKGTHTSRTMMLAELSQLLESLLLGRQMWSIVSNWTEPMFLVLIKSNITRAYPDQTCTLKKPADCSPKTEADAEVRLSKEDIEGFYDRGYLPPFDAFSEDEISAFGEEIRKVREEPSETYGFVTDRDRHFEMPTMMELLRRPAILERAAQLLGPDLLCWRSQFFYKPPRGDAVQWHQASSYMVEDALEPALLPPDRDELFQLTIWVAVDPATKANGCLRVIPGTAKGIRTVTFGGDEGFYHSRYTMDLDFDTAPVDYIEARPGQVIIFSERTVHGSSANSTDNSRSAFNFRLIRPDTVVYKDKKYHRAAHMNQKYRLDNWGCILMRGKDTHRLNKMVDGPAATKGATA